MTSLKFAFSTCPLPQGDVGSYSEAPEIGWVLMEMVIHPRTSNNLAMYGISLLLKNKVLKNDLADFQQHKLLELPDVV